MGPASVSQIFFRCLIFNCYNISICKKEKLKDETPKKNRETNGGQIKEQDVPLTWDSPQVCEDIQKTWRSTHLFPVSAISCMGGTESIM